jgi:DNA-binding transcriptional LysR family regulator
MATCRRAGFSPGIRHLANSIFTQLAMTASGLGVTLVPDVTVRQIQPAAPYRPLTDRTGIIELSLVTRGGAREPLTDHFLRIAVPLQSRRSGNQRGEPAGQSSPASQAPPATAPATQLAGWT